MKNQSPEKLCFQNNKSAKNLFLSNNQALQGRIVHREVYILKVRQSILVCFVVAMLLAVASSASAQMVEGTETQITTNESSQIFPDTHDEKVVWMDERNGNWDIYMYNVSLDERIQITTNESGQLYPAIYNNTVVWEDNRTANQDIFMYNLTSQNETQITMSMSNQTNPEIYNNTVVWEDDRNGNWDIFMHNLTSQNETQITMNMSNQTNPDIYNNTIVWEDNRTGNWDIFMYNLTSQNETQITMNMSNQTSPAIYKDTVVWLDDANNSTQVYLYNISTMNESRITTNESMKGSPAIYGDYVIWADNRSDNWDIYLYDNSSQQEFQVTENRSDQMNCTIYKNMIAWQDDRNNNWDIYMLTLGGNGSNGGNGASGNGQADGTAAIEVNKTFVSNADEDESADASVNDTLTYNITATNTGNTDLTNVFVEDNLTGQNKSCELLQPGKECVLTTEYIVNVTDPGTNISNMGTANSDQTRQVNDTENVTVPMPEMIIEKMLISNADEDGSNDVSVNDTLTYNITATNNGTANLTNVTVEDDMTGDNKSCPFLQPGEECTLSTEYVVQYSDIGTNITNTGTAYSNQTHPVNDTEEVYVPVPEMSIDKQFVSNADEDSSGNITANDTLTYNITATNTGESNLTNVVVEDDLTGNSTNCSLLQPGEQCPLTTYYVVKSSDVGMIIINTGSAYSNQTQPVYDTAQTEIVSAADGTGGNASNGTNVTGDNVSAENGVASNDTTEDDETIDNASSEVDSTEANNISEDDSAEDENDAEENGDSTTNENGSNDEESITEEDNTNGEDTTVENNNNEEDNVEIDNTTEETNS